MMKAQIKKRIAGLAAAVVAAALAVGFAGSSSAATPGLPAFGMTGDGLLTSFSTATPSVLYWVQRPSGFDGDTTIVGIDIRVQDGKLYVVGNRGGIYTVTVQAPNVFLTKVSQLTVPLQGSAFGVDFNPVTDRLRVASDTGQNLRHDLSGTTVALPGPAVIAAAYTNNDLHPDTGTTLFVFNTPPGHRAGFDIFSDLVGGKAVSNTGFATVISPSGNATLHTVDVPTGTTASVGGFPLPITDLAVSLDSMP